MTKKGEPAHHEKNSLWACTCTTCRNTVTLCADDKPSGEGWCFSDICKRELRTFIVRTITEYYQSIKAS